VCDAIPVGVQLEKFVDKVVDRSGVRVRARLAEHLLGDRAQQGHVVALDDGREMLVSESDLVGKVVTDRILNLRKLENEATDGAVSRFGCGDDPALMVKPRAGRGRGA
jgi:hypothetical protein